MQFKLSCLLLLAAAAEVFGARRHKLGLSTKSKASPRLLANGGAGLRAKLSANHAAEAACNSGTLSTKAPKQNIFYGLTDIEFANITTFLHQQKKLNLTAAANATSWDNVITTLDLLQPNKSDALVYLGGGKAPARYARATLTFGATTEPYFQEYMVGPLPVSKQTTYQELDFIYNSGRGRQRIYNADALPVYDLQISAGKAVANITKTLLNGTATGADDDDLLIGSNEPLIHEGDSIMQWNQFYAINTGVSYDETMLPTGLEFKTNITGRDPSKWAIVGWYYGGNFWPTTEAFIKAATSKGFKKYATVVDGDYGSTDPHGTPLPHDNLYPPRMMQPQGTRYAMDRQEQYVEWMGFSFYLGFSRDLGLELHNIEYQGQRTIYELTLQEALAQYAAMDPMQSSTAYLDSAYGFGQTSFELVQGWDCPAYADYLNASFYSDELTHTHANAICMFEQDPGFPIARHITEDYTTVTQNTNLVLRTVATVGNYDYLIEYAFHIDGSIHVTVRASGYIEGAYYAENQDYGFHIHDALSGDMHDHVINFKLDLDVLGTANSLSTVSVVPATVQYPWEPQGKTRNTMKLQRAFIENENDAKINWDYNAGVTYTVVNKDKPNKYGEYPGFSIAPGSGNTVHLTVQNSSDLGSSANWADHHMYAIKQHDNEPRSAYAYNNQDPFHPVVDFAKFFNGESLDQTDIVVYFNLGMHHVPQTSDLPNTVFTTAYSSVVIMPMNYFDVNPYSASLHAVRVNFNNGITYEVDTFGVQVPQCQLDFSSVSTNLSGYTGEIVVPKFPYDPTAAQLANPGES